MAGKNILLAAGQTLFKQGDRSDGMYLVRQGELLVFLQKNDRELSLARINEGGMIGEMALFDQKPRSASVRALVQTELTLISSDDFQKLLKQIPKWFTALMSTLSMRLRSTNERLERLEAENSTALKHILSTHRILHVLDLLWHRDGTKLEKTWFLEREKTIRTLVTIFHESRAGVEALLMSLVQEGFYTLGQDAYKNEVIFAASRATLTRFILFLDQFLQRDPKGPVEAAATDMLEILQVYSETIAHDPFTLSFGELEKLGQKAAKASLPNWRTQFIQLANLHEDIAMMQDKENLVILKVKKKNLKELTKFHRLLARICYALG